MKLIKLLALLAVSVTLFACGSSNKGTVSVPGNSTFKSVGGAGLEDGDGGSGGSVIFEAYGDVKVTTEGSVDTSFTVPAYTPNYGTKPLTITSDATVEVCTPAAESGYCANNGYLYNNLDEITGLNVASGATLTLPGGVSVRLFGGDIVIDGTIIASSSGGSIYLSTNKLLQIGSTGSVKADIADIYLHGGIAVNKGTIDSNAVIERLENRSSSRFMA